MVTEFNNNLIITCDYKWLLWKEGMKEKQIQKPNLEQVQREYPEEMSFFAEL